ncbi:hypothetical protein HDU86_000318 [Geranomyces michiganensis]|nr:hypothetical protein HDU86_000318 [Geranomyces michiganensis]
MLPTVTTRKWYREVARIGFLANLFLGKVVSATLCAGDRETASSSLELLGSTCAADFPSALATATYATAVTSASGAETLAFSERSWNTDSWHRRSTDYCYPREAALVFSAAEKPAGLSSNWGVSASLQPSRLEALHESIQPTDQSLEATGYLPSPVTPSTSEAVAVVSTSAPAAASMVTTIAAAFNASYRNSSHDSAHFSETTISGTSSTPSQSHSPLSVSSKTYKERFNFASFDCGALILAHNPEAGSATSILHNSKDAYMLNKCEAKRYVTVELCDEILVDTVMLANFEFFSSMFKDFQVHVSNRYPPRDNRWTLLGDFRAKNVRDFQYFKVGNPRIWARYLRVSFISEYSHEYYCPISMLRVYGTTMMEEVKAEEDKQSASEIVVSKSDDPVMLPGRSKESCESRAPNFLAASTYQRNPQLPLIGVLKKPWSQSSAGMELMEAFGTTPLPVFSRSEAESANASPQDILLPEQFYAVTNADASGRFTEAIRSQHVMADALAKEVGESVAAAAAAEVNHDSAPIDPGQATRSGAQESIFKTILKRISLLERNATLANLFLEEQSKALNDIFRQSLSREQERFDALLDHFNNTLYHIFTDLHMEYTKSWVMIVADVESEQQRADAKIAEVNRLMEMLDKQVRFP